MEQKLLECIYCDNEFTKLNTLKKSFEKILYIEYIGKSLWGIGHTLPAAYKAHEFCFKFKRNCFVKIYNTRVDEYFTFQNKYSWTISDVSFTNSNKTVIHAKNLKDIENIPDNDFVHIKIKGLIPFNSNLFLRYLPWDNGKISNKEKCFFRFVMWPKFSKLGSYLKYKIKKGIIHVRTGYADTPKLPSKKIKEKWFEELCDWEKLKKNYTFISDSPRIASYSFTNHETIPSSKSNFQITNLLFRDLVLAMLSLQAVTVKPSSFMRPLAIGSCIKSVYDIDSVCPKFTKIIKRDLVQNAFKAKHRYKTNRYSPESWHPCFNKTGIECGKQIIENLS